MHKKRSFTLTEFLIVLIILGVLITMVAPNFLSTYKHSEALHAAQDLQSIYLAQSLRLQEAGRYYASYESGNYDPKTTDVSGLNSNLGINITPSSQAKYACCLKEDPNGDSYCYASKQGQGRYTLRLKLNAPLNMGTLPKAPLYCNGTNNPCCVVGVSDTPGAPCPSGSNNTSDISCGAPFTG